MKRSLLVISILLFSFNYLYADNECNIDSELLEKGVNNKNKLYNYIKEDALIEENVNKYLNCFSSDDERYTNLLDLYFFDYLSGLNAWTEQRAPEEVTYLGNDAIESLNKYKDFYDNYEYYLSKYSLYLGNMYTFADKYHYNDKPDLEKAKEYLNVYEKNKSAKLKRVTFLLIDTDLSLNVRNTIDKKVENTFNKIDLILNKTNIDNQNKNISELINQFNLSLEEKQNDEFVYTTTYLKYLLQNRLYYNIVQKFNNEDYIGVINDSKMYLDAFDYSEKNFGTLRNERFYKILDLLFASYKSQLDIYNSDFQKAINLGVEAFEEINNYGTISGDNKTNFNDSRHYYWSFSCTLGNTYSIAGDTNNSKEYLNICDKYQYNNFPKRGGFLIGK